MELHKDSYHVIRGDGKSTQVEILVLKNTLVKVEVLVQHIYSSKRGKSIGSEIYSK